MEKQQRSKFRPNLMIMIIGVTIITVTGMVTIGAEASLPLATAATGGLATLGLALIRPDDEPPLEKHDPDVVLPASAFKSVGMAGIDAYDRGFHKGFAAGQAAVKKE